MVRLLLILIPILTFLVKPRWFSYYAMLMMGVVLYAILMFVVLNDQAQAAYAEFGVHAAIGYLLLNLVLLGVRYYMIRRARARITKLPAPTK